MESLGKDHPYSDSSLPPSAARKDYAVPGLVALQGWAFSLVSQLDEHLSVSGDQLQQSVEKGNNGANTKNYLAASNDFWSRYFTESSQHGDLAPCFHQAPGPHSDVIITHRLRDRELLRKRKVEAQERDSVQWDLREQEKNKRQRRGRGARRGRGRQMVVEPNLEPEPEPESQPDPQKEAEAAPPEPVHQEQLPMLTIHDLDSGMQPRVVEEKLAVRNQDPVGELPDTSWPREEEVLKPAEAEIPEVLNTPLEYDHQDNQFHKHILF